jgi:hypothetical protein
VHARKIAGLAGIGFGVFLLLFQGVLKKQFLPQAGLTSAQAFAVILSLMILTYGIAAIGVVAWLVSRSTKPQTPMPATSLIPLAALTVLVLGAAVYVGLEESKRGAYECQYYERCPTADPDRAKTGHRPQSILSENLLRLLYERWSG